MNHKLNPWLDLCRALAICLVLLSHGRIFLKPVFPDSQLFKFGGFMGVELFFVLSGFLIGRIIFSKIDSSQKPFDWISGFWFRRWMRTYPSYILFLFINIILITTIRQESFPNIVEFSTFTQSLLSPHPSFFGEAWSLAVEEVFYFITPLVMSFSILLTKNKNVGVLMSMFIMLLVPLLLRVHATLYTNMTFNEIRTISLYRVDSIMIGVVFAWLFIHDRINKFAILGLILIPLTVYIAAKPDDYIDKSIVLKIFLFNISNIGFACLIVSGYKINITGLLRKITAYVARWSYAAYLTNLPVLLTIRYFTQPPITTFNCILLWATFIFFTLLSAAIVYSLFERKVLKYRDAIRAK
ncbi:acyltransferase family protein [Serratia sp. (in: enterobacteria)]|uniref:acyltransferase family protein n=1 Tax=Serratia sp. (in: enterobacteria) TaxID=616 RepID=UPI0039895979